MDKSVNQIKSKDSASKVERGQLQQYLNIRMTCWSGQTKVIKNPLGILSLSSFKLINGLEEKRQKGFKLQIEANGLRLNSALGEEAELSFDKEEPYVL